MPIEDAPDARQEVQARHRHRRGPDRHQGRAWRARYADSLRDRAAPGRRHRRGRMGRRGRGRDRAAAACCSPRSSPARSPASPSAEIEPRLFSFNNPFGACPACDGLGVKLTFDADLVVPDRTRPCTRARSRPGRAAPRRSTPRPCRRWPATTASRWTSPGTTCRRRPSDVILHGTGRREDQVHLRRQRPQIRGLQALRGRAAQPGAPLARDRLAPGCARSWAATSPRRRARPATATA